MQSNEIITISGKRGYGKTTYAMNMIRGLKRVAIWDIMNEYNHPGSYVPSRGDVDEFNEWLRVHWNNGNVFLLIDEADQVLAERKELPLYANKIINLGRHKNIGMGMITRRLARLNKTAFSQSHHVVLFHHFMPNDIKYLQEFIPDAQSLKSLQKYQFKKYQF